MQNVYIFLIALPGDTLINIKLLFKSLAKLENILCQEYSDSYELILFLSTATHELGVACVLYKKYMSNDNENTLRSKQLNISRKNKNCQKFKIP